MSRPVPIPAGWVDRSIPADVPRTVRVLSAPNGDLTDERIAPVEAVMHVQNGETAVTVLWRLDADEVDALRDGALLALTTIGGLPPHNIEVVAP